MRSRLLLSENQNGVTLQVGCTLIAALLIGLWVGAKPDTRTYEMICHDRTGWATLEELERHLEKLRKQQAKPP